MCIVYTKVKFGEKEISVQMGDKHGVWPSQLHSHTNVQP